MIRRSSFSRKLGLLLPALALLAGGFGTALAGFQEKSSLGADTLTVNNLVGAIEVRGHGGSSFEVTVQVKGRDASAENVRIETREGSRSEFVVVFPVDRERHFVYPEMGKGSRSTISLDNDESSWLGKLMGEMLNKRVTVSGSGSGLEIWADVEVLVPSGKTLIVKHGVGAIVAEDVKGELTLDSSSGPVTVRSIEGELLVDTGSGEVRAEDIRGKALIDTGSGRVTVIRFEGESLNVDTGSGRVEIDQADARRLDVDTGSGSVDAKGVRTDGANIDTGSGSITLQLDRMGGGDYNLDTGSGRITLALPADASADVRASTGSGGIDIELDGGVQMRRRDRDEASFSIGSGDARVELDTGSGGIRIVRSD